LWRRKDEIWHYQFNWWKKHELNYGVTDMTDADRKSGANYLDVEKDNGVLYLRWLLSQMDTIAGKKIFVRPGSEHGKAVQNLPGLEYRLCREGEDNERTLCVMLDQRTTDGSLNREAEWRLRSAISAFWADGNEDTFGSVFIVY
jgi:hypothetical protein